MEKKQLDLFDDDIPFCEMYDGDRYTVQPDGRGEWYEFNEEGIAVPLDPDPEREYLENSRKIAGK